MTDPSDAEPRRSELHDALAAFLGDWRATGRSYASPEQDPDDPKRRYEAWNSTHTGRWHTGRFFLVQDERARLGDGVIFDTLALMGVEEEGSRYFAWTVDNHGYRRRYALSRDGATWTLSGETERATIVFSDDLRQQAIAWEWRVHRRWLPLCDRVAEKLDSATQ